MLVLTHKYVNEINRLFKIYRKTILIYLVHDFLDMCICYNIHSPTFK